MANQNSSNDEQLNSYNEGLANFSQMLSQCDPSLLSQSQSLTPQQQVLNPLNFAQQYTYVPYPFPLSQNMFGMQPFTPPITPVDVEEDVLTTPTNKGKDKAPTKMYNKRKPKDKTGESSVDTSNDAGKQWKPHDLKVLANAWLSASEVPSGRSGGRFFYTRVNDYYNQDPECMTKRSFEATKAQWYVLNGICTKYKGIIAQRGNRLRSGQTYRDLKDEYDKIYRETYRTEFKAHDAFEILSQKPRWSELTDDGLNQGDNEQDSLRNVVPRNSMDSSPGQSNESPVTAETEGTTSNPPTPTSGMLYSGVANRPEGVKSSKRSVLRNKETSELLQASNNLTALLKDISINSSSKKEERLRLKQEQIRVYEAHIARQQALDEERTKALMERNELKKEKNEFKKARERRIREKQEEEFMAKDVSHLSGEFLEYVLSMKREILAGRRQRSQEEAESSEM